MKKLLGLLFGVLFSIPAFATLPQAAINAGYTEVEYIESTGTQYIDTGYFFTDIATETVTIDFMRTGTGAGSLLYGTRKAYKDNGYAIQFQDGGDTFMQYGGIDSGIGSAAPGALNTRYTLIQTGPTYSFRGASYTSTGATPTQSYPLYLFTTNNGGSPSSITPMRVYSFVIKDSNNNIKLNLVPVKKTVNGTDVYGMYNMLDSNPETAFYGNAGTGEFIGGPEVCPNGGTLQTYVSATGTVVQNGTPTPTNPITPTFYTQGNMILRKVGNIADSYDASTGKITRRVAVVVFDGTESWAAKTPGWEHNLQDAKTGTDGLMLSHFGFLQSGGWADVPVYYAKRSGTIFRINYPEATTAAELKSWLAAQYNAGTPVTVYYPLATPVKEDWAVEQCDMPIKIATRAYNTTQFAPVVTALNTAVDTIKNVVTNTINQTAAVSALQSTKQTRPDEECPAGKKCLLVEDVDGTPHWYEIIERAPGIVPAGSGYTQVAYLQMPAGSYINTTVVPQGDYRIELDFATTSLPASNTSIFGERGQNEAGAGIQIGLGTTGQFTLDGLGSRYQPTTLATANTRYKYVWDNKTVTLTSGSTTIGTNTFTDSQEQTYPLVINRLNNAGTMAGNAQIRSYSFKAWNASGSYVADFVPARRNSDGVLGMYDTVSGNFFTNAGSGEFTTPVYLPASYTPLEYIQSTGTQYIDTGILLSNTDVFEITFQSLNKLETPVMGAISGGASYTSTNNLSVTYTLASGLSDYSVYCDGAAGNADYSWNGGNRTDGLKHTIKYNGLNIAPTIDGVAMTQITPTTLVANTPTVTTWLFGRNNTSTGTLSQSGVRIYDFHIHNKGHFVPAQNSSGVVGMYNVLDNNPATAFHTNAGTGTFTAGPVVQ